MPPLAARCLSASLCPYSGLRALGVSVQGFSVYDSWFEFLWCRDQGEELRVES